MHIHTYAEHSKNYERHAYMNKLVGGGICDRLLFEKGERERDDTFEFNFAFFAHPAPFSQPFSLSSSFFIERQLPLITFLSSLALISIAC